MQENKVNAPEVSEEEQLIEQARIRREKLAKLVSEGKNPYEQVKYPVDAHSEEIKNNFSKNLSRLRKDNGLTQLALAEKLNYSDKAISKWERGEGLPDAYVLSKMSELFGVTVDYMLTPHSDQNKKVETKPIKKAKKIKRFYSATIS